MFTRITTLDNCVNVSLVSVTFQGVGVNPTSASATFYLVSPTTGALSVAITVGTVGVVALALQAGVVGFWGAGVNVSTLAAGQYVVLFKVIYDGTTHLLVDSFVRESSIGSSGSSLTLEKALAVLVAQAIGNASYDPALRRWTVYDTDGVTAIARVVVNGNGNRGGSEII